MWYIFISQERKFDKLLYFCTSHIQIIIQLIHDIENDPPHPRNSYNKSELAEEVQINEEVVGDSHCRRDAQKLILKFN